MYNKFQLATKYLRYWLTASNGRGHGTHSPFVYDFIRSVLIDRTIYPEYDRVESLRRELLTDQSLLTIEDMGAGSAMSKSQLRTVASIAANAAKPAKYGQLLFRMARHYQPAVMLELGTSLGLTTAYLSLAQPAATVITMEGATAVAAKARENFDILRLSSVTLQEGNFDTTLAPLLATLRGVDFVFIDGNHRMQPTIDYFNLILSKTTNLSIIVLDDIHWSAGMEAAWEHCKADPAVTLSIDLFFIGILVLRKEIKEKQHFCIRF